MVRIIKKEAGQIDGGLRMGFSTASLCIQGARSYMGETVSINNGRYLLYIDILGFSNLVETLDTEETYNIIEESLKAFECWEGLNNKFRIIYFSDSFIFYQEPKGYGDWAFLDAYAIGGMILSALLAKKIPARGAISFGEFEVRDSGSGRHQVYFGKALIEAYKAEQKENWIGISILPSAWKPYENRNKGAIKAFELGRVWKKRCDGMLMLNPFVKLRSWYGSDLVTEDDEMYSMLGGHELHNDVLAFRFLREKANEYSSLADFSSKEAMKYHLTVAFLKEVLGESLYDWGVDLSEKINA